MQKKTFYNTEKYLKSHLMLFPIFAYTKNFLDASIVSIWISLCIILPALIINQIELKKHKSHILEIYLLIIGIFTGLTYLFMFYLTPTLYKEFKFSIPILIAIIISFHKNEPFKILKNPLMIIKYSKAPLLIFIVLSSTISLIREILNTGNLKLFNKEIPIIKELINVKMSAHSSNIFIVASLVLLLINIIKNVKEKK
ncbi:hypothetical protein QIA37_03540 [Borrelia sp. CA_690]|uniref:Uncharacterized protein n=1 Tax=Borrelia maritima TaxID=2761123 RepID=A0A5J6WF68_9SPIR|nr:MULTISPECIES: hypothetical protein [Borrelia]QFI14699.1 hypothetical protein DB723_02965 [Borrelia maritima]WKC84559.1 hypothetical protein QIA37_03540 [Borrelia sp. CA_690]